MPEVRLVGEDGKQIGVLKTPDALVYAQERDLDLVEVAPEARPPVCRVLDYSKFKYEQAQKQKAARKHQQQITIREIKFRPKIAQNDYDTKKGHVERFLKGKDKVKITIMFRGREVTHPERGVALLEKLAGELAELAVVEQNPLQDGRNMTMMLAPSKSVLAADEHEHEEPEELEGEEHRSGKKVHKHDLNAAKHDELELEAEIEEEDDLDEDGEPAPITEIEPITVIEPEPEPAALPEPVAEDPAVLDVEETPGGRPAQKSKHNARNGAAAKRAAALQAVADAEALSTEPGSVSPAPEPAEAAATAKSGGAEAGAKRSSTKAKTAPKPAAPKPAASKPTSPKPRAPKSNGTPNGTNGANGSTGKSRAKSASKAS